MLMSPASTVCLTIRDPAKQALARYSLEEAATRLGVPLRVVAGEPAEGMIVYGAVPSSWRGAVLHYDRRCYEPAVRFAAVGSPPLWAPEGADPSKIDLIGGIGRLLTLVDEVQVAEGERNARGIFRTRALPAGRRGVQAEPLVEHHAAFLAEQLKMLRSDLPPPCPAWPTGYRYAVLIVHDTDLVALNAPQEILFNMAKTVLRLDREHARMAWAGMTRKHDPLAAFMTWAEAEGAVDVRSAFFLSDRKIVPRHLNDCRSTVFNQNLDWGRLRALADAGWEFGCHPPIRATENTQEFVQDKSALEARLHRPVYGVRHHYLALDWRRPYLTFRQHLGAGFRYDMSIAWRDAPGFRAGSSLPYRPYDPERARALEFCVLPATIMDLQLMGQDVDQDEAESQALQVIDRIRQVGGMVVLDWHTESAMNLYCYRNYHTVLLRLIHRLRGDTDAWFATPWELTQHWMERRRRLVIEAVN